MSSLALINNHSACMENNTIGPIDKLIIFHHMRQQRYKTLKRTIDQHEFEFTMPLPGKDGNIVSLTEQDPFEMKFICHRKNKSNVAQHIFASIAAKQKIDACTTWKPTHNPDFVEVITKFYNKEELLTELDIIHHGKKRNVQSTLTNKSPNTNAHTAWKATHLQ